MSIDHAPTRVPDRIISDIDELVQQVDAINIDIELHPREVSDLDKSLLEYSVLNIQLRASLVLEQLAHMNLRLAHAQTIAEQYFRDFEQEQGYEKTDEEKALISARLKIAAFSEYHYVTDMDGTMIFEDPTAKGPHYYKTHIAGTLSSKPKQKGHDDHSAFAVAHRAGWKIAMDEYPDTMRSSGKLIPLRSGATDLVHTLKKAGWSGDILSTGFRPVVEGALSQEEAVEAFFDLSTIRVVESLDIGAVDKYSNIIEMAGTNPNRLIFYAGDGGSDIQLAVPTLPIIHIALAGGSYQKALEQAGIPHFVYTTLTDIADIIVRILKTTVPETYLAKMQHVAIPS